MTVNQLKKYRSICAELEDIEQEIENCYVGDTVQTGSKFPFKVHNEQIQNYVSNRNTSSLLTRKSTLKELKADIDSFVSSIEEYQIRSAIEIYYIRKIELGESKPTWEDVADVSRVSQTSNAIKKMVNRYLKESEQCHTCHTCHNQA